MDRRNELTGLIAQQPRHAGRRPDDPDAARAWIAKNFSIYGTLPSYRAMLDREGAAGPADVAIAGDEQALRAALDRLRDLGVSDFSAAVAAVDAETGGRTLDFLAAYGGSSTR